MEISDDYSIQKAFLELGEGSSKISFEKLLPEGKEILRSGAKWQVPCRNRTDSSLDSVLKDRTYAELPVQRSPKGLSAISDSIDMRPLKGAPKPNPILRIGYSMALKVFQIMTLGIELWAWVFERILGRLSQRSLYEKLYEISLKGNAHEIQNFLKKHSQSPSTVGYLFSEFQNLPGIVAHLPEILKGANVCLEGDQGFFYSRWKSHAESYPRVSSHRYQPNTCFAMDHVLFWLDLEGNTRFQFENSPLNSLLSSMRHFADYLRYKRDNEQQGVTGASAFTEEHPLRLRGCTRKSAAS